MHHQYPTRGVCPSSVEFDLEGDVVHGIRFTGGCNGNLKGISRLAEGRSASEIAEILKGTTCGFKNTSCPDQLAKALEGALKQEAK